MMQPDQNPQPLLSVRDLKVRFGSKQVVHGVSFDVRAGEKLALVGESGSGKTVTALSLLRLGAKPSSAVRPCSMGEICWH